MKIGQIDLPSRADHIRYITKTHKKDSHSFFCETGPDDTRTSSSQKKTGDVSFGGESEEQTGCNRRIAHNGPGVDADEREGPDQHNPTSKNGEPPCPVSVAFKGIGKKAQEAKGERAPLVFFSDSEHDALVQAEGLRVVQEGYIILSDWKVSKAEVDPKALTKSTDLHHMKWAIEKAKKSLEVSGRLRPRHRRIEADDLAVAKYKEEPREDPEKSKARHEKKISDPKILRALIRAGAYPPEEMERRFPGQPL